MYAIKEQKILSYPVNFLYSIITDVEKYPTFLPWFKSIVVTKQDRECIFADVVAQYKGIREKYKSIISLHDKDSTKVVEIKAEKHSVLLKFLKSKWVLEGVTEGSTKVSFSIEFQFNSSILEKLASLLLMRVKHEIVKSFENRAKLLFADITNKIS